jgi:hypothetical protein
LLYFNWDYSYFFIIFLVMHRASNLMHDTFSLLRNLNINQVLKRK